MTTRGSLNVAVEGPTDAALIRAILVETIKLMTNEPVVR